MVLQHCGMYNLITGQYALCAMFFIIFFQALFIFHKLRCVYIDESFRAIKQEKTVSEEPKDRDVTSFKYCYGTAFPNFYSEQKIFFTELIV